MATFVDITSEEEQILTLVQYVSNLKKKRDPENEQQFTNECTRLLQENRPREVILKLISEHESIFQDSNDKEIEACMSVISSLIRKMEPDVANMIGVKLREAVTYNLSDRALLRLKILTGIYHAFDQTSLSRYETFMALAKYAADSGNAELIIPKFKQIDKWLLDWSTDVEQSRRLYKLVRNILKDNHRGVQAHKFLVKYLQTFSPILNEGGNVDEEVVGAAAEASLEAIALDDLYQCDHLLSLPAVRLLETHPQHAPLFQLLRIFAQEKLDAFQAFVRNNPSFLQNVGLREENCVRKMRLLSLASLGTESEEIPYHQIAETLQISEDEVEDWVIMTVSAKLMDAKLSQMRRVVIVRFCVQRVFTTANWKQLSGKLDKWKNNIRQLLQVVQQTKGSALGIQAQAFQQQAQKAS
jgi:translation initiation factor 3 subunit M